MFKKQMLFEYFFGNCWYTAIVNYIYKKEICVFCWIFICITKLTLLRIFPKFVITIAAFPVKILKENKYSAETSIFTLPSLFW